jgi:hypothetical protein
MPSLACFALGFYLIYFRKSRLLLIALFAFATLNRETTLFLIPFYLLSELARDRGPAGPNLVSPGKFSVASKPSVSDFARFPGISRIRFSILREISWQRLLRPEVLTTTALLLVYWAAWHIFIFHFFRRNSSEYYSRLPFNSYTFTRLRYYPQLLSACGYLLPFLLVFRKHVHDAQLRLWMWAIPGWYAVMAVWGILVETRVFGELLPFVACIATLIAEEVFAAAVLQRRQLDRDAGEDRVHLVRAA